MMEIDGSQGEGGGQILRTALSLAAITGQPLRLTRIRGRRPKPGLQRQHLAAVQAVAQICAAEVDGDELGSGALYFRPQAAISGDYSIDIGSAGSATLVLQTLLPILARGGGPSTLHIRGGTHNPLAPSADFIQRSWLPLLKRCGWQIDVTCQRRGFSPVGLGELQASIAPLQACIPLELVERGKFLARDAEVLLANLPAHIAQREAATLKHALHWSDHEIRQSSVDASGPGNCIQAQLDFAQVTVLCSAIGSTGKRAEAVANECARTVKRYLASDAPVCEYLADQLLLPLALGAGGRIRCRSISEHCRSNAAVINQFLGPVVELGEDGWIQVEAWRG
ncbi:MAG: RNA 3'-terminal phosphate cyclase [Planctomycetota bacterium]|nr:MAG: RNA 3'-terminal phosphate cyclase [Planctomycetota bacterium]